MAYITTERVKEIRNELKKEFPNLKLSVRTVHYSTVYVSIMSGDIDFANETTAENYKNDLIQYGHVQINEYHIPKGWTGKALETLLKIKKIISKGHEDKSDSMTDYFYQNFYYDIEIGKWDRPYIYTSATVKKEIKNEIEKVNIIDDIEENQNIIKSLFKNITNENKQTFVELMEVLSQKMEHDNFLQFCMDLRK